MRCRWERTGECRWRYRTGCRFSWWRRNPFAGYSGGVKTIAIGAAGEETIGATHNYEVMKETRLGVLEGNRFRDFLTEASLTLGVDFIVNVVQTGDKKLVAAFAGHPVEAFHAGVRVAPLL
ncbi:MAG: lactate racemase domain-containing protein [Syntrophothermus sp.]